MFCTIGRPLLVVVPILFIKKVMSWAPPLDGVLKFNVDGAARGKQGPAGIGGVFRNSNKDVLMVFSKSIGVKD